MSNARAIVTLTADGIARVIDDAIERRVKDLRDRMMLVEMNVRELQQKAFIDKPRLVRVADDGRPVVRVAARSSSP